MRQRDLAADVEAQAQAAVLITVCLGMASSRQRIEEGARCVVTDLQSIVGDG